MYGGFFADEKKAVKNIMKKIQSEFIFGTNI